MNEETCRGALKTTVDWYNLNASKFIALNDATDHSTDYQAALALVQTERPVVVDVGCAQGRDIQGFLNRGVEKVIGIEPSQELALHAQQRTKQTVLNKRFEDVVVGKDIPAGSVDLVWAMAAFLHIPLSRQVEAFQKISELLRVGGVARLSYKVGQGERLENRDGLNLIYTDMTEAVIREIIWKIPSLEIVSLNIETDYNRKNIQWLKIFVRKKA